MGTRADFYVGRGKSAEWLGSIAMDGYPDGNVSNPQYGPLIKAASEPEFRERVAMLIAGVGHGTTPAQGWPWPWEDSRTTDYAYAFDGGTVWASGFGRAWFDPNEPEPDRGDEPKSAVFPNMKDRQRVTLGSRSGLIVFGG